MTVATKKHISKMLTEEFSVKEYNSFSIKEISKISNLARSTVYYQFSSLSDVYRYLLEENIMRKTFDNAKSWQDVVNLIIDYIDNNKKLCINLYNHTSKDKRYEYCQNQIFNIINRYNGCYTIYYSYEELKIYNQELDYMIDVFIFTLERWLDCGLRDEAVNIKKKMYGYLEIIMRIVKSN